MMKRNNNLQPGDWICGNCRFRNVASERQCQHCNIIRSSQTRRDPIAGVQRNVPMNQQTRIFPPRNKPVRRGGSHILRQPRGRSCRGSQSLQDISRENGRDRDMDISSRNPLQTRRDPVAGSQRNGPRYQQSKTPAPRNRTGRGGGVHMSGQPGVRSCRGSQSSQDLSMENGRASGIDISTKNPDRGRRRRYPIGFKALEKMLSQHPEDVVMELQTENSGFDLLLEDLEGIDADKMFLMIRVLARATETRSYKEGLNILITNIFKPRFINHLVKFSLTIVLENIDVEKVSVYFENLWIVLDTFSHAMPSLAMDQIFILLESCLMYINRMSDCQMSELLTKYEGTKSYLECEKTKWPSQGQKASRKQRQRWQENLQPPENFRELPITPTVKELNDPYVPFLRENIIHGKYEDVEQYLDVQFRLLREDFVRPLRNGIQEFKVNVKSHNRDLYIYKDVQIVGTDRKNFKLFHCVKVTFPEKFKPEKSKRLMYGNLVCLSNDNFETVLFGSVAERNPEMLKEGLLGVEFDSEIKYKTGQIFTMVESRSFFTAYKHVLSALQGIMEDTFPMEDFIVHVENDMCPPDYVTGGIQYDLQVMRSKNMMKTSEIYSRLFQQQRNIVQPQPCAIPVLQNVNIQRELDFWPSCKDLAIDDSQRRALKSALTSKLSIIQGPPGTGKTFLGLKIAQVLLHNSQHWKTETHSSPILVVCFTNHALDQFLEGMIPFTKNIVRVGSRTKNEIIQDFQINSLVRNLSSRRAMPNSIQRNYGEIMKRLKQLEKRVKDLRQMLLQLRNPTGILMLIDLISHHVIPDRIAQQLQAHKLELAEYLLDPRFADNINQRTSDVPCVNEVIGDPVANFEPDENILEDADDLYADEEDTRMLDDDYDDHQSNIVTSTVILSYATSLEKLRYELWNLDECMNTTPSLVEVLECETKIIHLGSQHNLLKYGLNVPLDLERAIIIEREIENITRLPFEERWMLYRLWLQRMVSPIIDEMSNVENEFKSNAAVFSEIKDHQYLHVMRHASVIGMTTTGAATNHNILQSLQPSIVIIEEAAEILEAHVITSLTHKCQHLIMIGDHQQLQPSATVYELAKYFGLETSLFERLVKNGVAYETLEYQHRMRPNISRLLVPSIYPNLKDHESVHEHPHVKGMLKDVFFITHQQHEEKAGDDNGSRSNTHEANLIMALCRHLMLQGYSSEDITVLTPYTGQFFLLKKLQRKYRECDGVRISVVDNFQGEESNIILLSLVRSNEDGIMGFLRKENRICVALSRAKHGLYVTGNMDQLKASSDLWKQIQSDLVDDEAIGNSIVLQCENHPAVFTSVSSHEDILSKSPEGGCRTSCTASLPKCGHKCPKICHTTDLEHVRVRCPLPCPIISCERKHPCPQKCWETCNPCIVPVLKMLPCSHTHGVHCCEFDNKQKCPTLVERVLPDCQHNARMQCHNNPSTFPCPTPCEIRLPCGHKCTRKCHVNDDPDHVDYRCDQSCPRSPEGCSGNHKCIKECYEDCGPCTVKTKKKAECGHSHEVNCSTPVEEIICNLKCKRMLPCGHHCRQKCKDPCGGCRVKVNKTIPECEHIIKVECSQPASKTDCLGNCILKLPCGHRCKAFCKDPCTVECKTLVPSEHKCPKGHAVKVPCYLLKTVTEAESWVYCSEPCGVLLDCKHVCKGQCGLCLHGRLHIACSEKCGKTLVCGHICKADCSSACPPCQETCPMRCMHSHCIKICGEPCSPCQEECLRRCEHQNCKNVCGKECSQELCEKPCPKQLDCGHPCVGYCGDPCPPLCRICNEEELTRIVFGFEDDDDARFVLLEDCGHVYEATGLQRFLAQERSEIGMTSCPLCKTPIYNNHRNNKYIIENSKNVHKVKSRYYKKDPKEQEQDIKLLLTDLKSLPWEEARKISRFLPQIPAKSARQRFNVISDNEITLYTFQVQVLKKINSLQRVNIKYTKALEIPIDRVKKRAMEQKLRISPQMVEEITCELQRLRVLPPYWELLENARVNSNPVLQMIQNKMKVLMDPTIKFDEEQEAKVKRKLKIAQLYVGGLGITEEERLVISEAMGMKQGHWFKCPNGHIYCIANCGRAVVEAECPECHAKIGGGNHTLRSDNAVATEMVGARRDAASSNLHDIMRSMQLGN